MPHSSQHPKSNETIFENAKRLDDLARELDSLTVIERAYAMQAYSVFVKAAALCNCTIGDFINTVTLDLDKAAMLVARSKNQETSLQK